MHRKTVLARRSLVMLLTVLGLMGLTLNTAGAREICNPNGNLALADGNGDGVVSRGEIQAIIDGAGNAEGVDQLQSLLNGLPGDVTGFRYRDCVPGSDGGDGGTGDGGTGTGDGGTGTGSGTGTGTESGTGTGDGGTATGTGTTGTGSGTGTATGTGTGTGTGTTGDGQFGAGTAFEAITGLPDTGQGSAVEQGAISVSLIFGFAGLATLLAGLAIRARSLPE